MTHLCCDGSGPASRLLGPALSHSRPVQGTHGGLGQCDTLVWQRLSLQAVIAGLELPGVTTSVGSCAPVSPHSAPARAFLPPFHSCLPSILCPQVTLSTQPAPRWPQSLNHWSGELLLPCFLPCPVSRCFLGFRTQGPRVGRKGELSEPLMRKGYLKEMEFEVCLQGLKKGRRCCEPG